jgi:branched-chain amino acid transport system substrate-binding protein
LLVIGLQPVQAQTPIKIGLAATTSGWAAPFGIQERIGALAATDWINAKGGIFGHPVEIVLVDDRCDPVRAKKVAAQLVNQSVRAVIGHVCGSSALAAASIYSTAKIPFITLSDLPKLTELDAPGIFRLCGRLDKQTLLVTDYLRDTFGPDNVGTIISHKVYGKSINQKIRHRYPTLQFIEPVPEINTLAPLIDRLAVKRLAAVMVAGATSEIGDALASISGARGLKVQFVFANAATQPTFLNKITRAREGAIFFSTCYVPFPDEELYAMIGSRESLLSDLKDIGFALHAFAALEVIAEAAQLSGSLDFDGFTRAMRSNVFKTVIGTLRFDGNGDIAPAGDNEEFTNLYVYQRYMIENGNAARWTQANPCTSR